MRADSRVCVVAFGLAFSWTFLLGGAETTSKKVPLPDTDAQAAATKLVKEVYGDKWAVAKTESAKQALAKDLLEKAKENEDGSAAQYVLLRLARDIATRASDGSTALLAIDEMGGRFQIDAVEMKAAVLTKLVAVSRTADQHKAMAEQALALSDVAITADNFEVAARLGKLASSETAKARDKELNRRVRERIAEIGQLAALYEAVKEGAATLQKSPDDAGANLAVGKYKCLVKGDWEGGLPMLALGSDQSLKKLATRELDGAASSDSQVSLGDGWWGLAEAGKGLAKKQLQERAAFWYRKALPGLSGLAKDKVEKRLQDIAVKEGPEESQAAGPGKRSKGGWTVIFRSADPSIWNSSVHEGQDKFAVSLDSVPEGVKFLSLRIADKDPIIIEITKSQLENKHEWNDYGWNGTSEFQYNAHRLGVYKKSWQKMERGRVQVIAPAISGWGFGVRNSLNDKQGYVWAGQAIEPTVFEISVRSAPLPKKEEQFLLK